MKIFIGWSGDRSEKIAEQLTRWLPTIDKEYEPWFSDEIPSGEIWLTYLKEEIISSGFGILCVTPENLNAPWLIFEAGVLDSQNKKVVPLLYDVDKMAIITSPLAMFQYSTVSEKGMLKIVQSLNSVDGNKLTEDHLTKRIKEKWPQLEEAISEIPDIETETSVDTEKKYSYNVGFDCTEEEFLHRLINCESATIIGITNERLRGYLEKAFIERCKEGGKGAWEELKIIFSARHLLGNYPRQNGAKEDLENIYKKWDEAVTQIREFILGQGDGVRIRPAINIDIRSYDKPLTFIGQVYNQSDIRVTFILPDSDLQKSCYMNFQKGISPCSNIEYGCCPPRKMSLISSTNCNGCKWEKDYSPCKAIFEAMDRISTGSTPLFSANVVGCISENQENKEQYLQFVCLCPQNNWRKFKLDSDEKPVHLLAFTLLLKGDCILLQYRNDSNSSGDTGIYGVLPGKVNGEDFLDNDIDKEYRNAVYKMQKAWDSRGARNKEYLEAFWQLQMIFSNITKLEKGKPILDEQLEEACSKAAIRTVKEKVGLNIASKDLTLLPRSFVVERETHILFIKAFLLDMSAHYIFYKERANLEKKTRNEIEELKNKNQLTPFLKDNLDFLFDNILQAGNKS